MLRDLNKLSGGMVVCGTHLVGVPASDLPTGFPLAGLINNDVSANDPAGTLYRVEVTQRPSVGNLVIAEHGAFAFTNAPDGVYTGSLTNYKNDVPEAGTYSFTIGPTVTGVSVTPSAPTVLGGATQQFAATVTGLNSPSQSVTWTKTGPGTLSASGLFTAPAATSAAQSVTITATSTADGTKSGSTTVTISALVPTVSSVVVTPASGTLSGGATQQFVAAVNGSNSPAQTVTWTKTGGGTLSASGLFTAPAASSSAQTITVTATSTVDATKSGSAIITVDALVATVTSVTVTPTTLTLLGDGTQQFSAVVDGANSPAQTVTWTKSGGGTISASGLYTAPSAIATDQVVTVTATSTVDGTKAGTATITILAALPTVTGVSVSPSVAALTGQEQQQFVALVTGTFSPPQAVVWSKTGGGTLSADGLFSAPIAGNAAQTIVITATSVFDGSKAGSAVVTVAAAPTVTDVIVSPVSIQLDGLATQQFAALVNGTGSPMQGVIWSLNGPGTLTADGFYTASATADDLQIATITATSVLDGTKSGSANVTIAAAPVVTTRAPGGGGFKPRRSKRIRPPAIQE